jgi:hypothetical protein
LVTSEEIQQVCLLLFLVVFEIVRRIFFLHSWEIAFLELLFFRADDNRSSCEFGKPFVECKFFHRQG